MNNSKNIIRHAYRMLTIVLTTTTMLTMTASQAHANSDSVLIELNEGASITKPFNLFGFYDANGNIVHPILVPGDSGGTRLTIRNASNSRGLLSVTLVAVSEYDWHSFDSVFNYVAISYEDANVILNDLLEAGDDGIHIIDEWLMEAGSTREFNFNYAFELPPGANGSIWNNTGNLKDNGGRAAIAHFMLLITLRGEVSTPGAPSQPPAEGPGMAVTGAEMLPWIIGSVGIGLVGLALSLRRSKRDNQD